MTSLTTNDWLNFGKFMLAALLFTGYFLILILSMMITLAPDAGTIILQGLAVLGPVIGAVASNMWPRGNDQDRATIQDLAQKVPPVTGEAKVSQDESLGPITLPPEAAADGSTDAPWFDPSSPRPAA